MSEVENKGWPQIRETTEPGKRVKGVRKFTIQDARNTWEIEIRKADSSLYHIKMNGFKKFYFTLDMEVAEENEEGRLRCFKDFPIKVSDSGQMASTDHRFNLIDDEGNRKTLRLKKFKDYLEKIV